MQTCDILDSVALNFPHPPGGETASRAGTLSTIRGSTND